jgi:hypothetical protein
MGRSRFHHKRHQRGSSTQRGAQRDTVFPTGPIFAAKEDSVPILQINFKLNVPANEYASDCQNFLQAIAAVSGLRWKIWILNEQDNEAGGIYCFDTEEALNDYLSGPIVAQLANYPAIRDVTVKRFDVMEQLTSATRGPIATMAARQ